MAAADRLMRAAAATGPPSSYCPRSGPPWAPRSDLRAAAETLEGGPAVEWARELARELAIDLVAGSILERSPGQEKLANTSVHVIPRGRSGPSTARCTCSTSRSRGAATASPSWRTPAMRSCSRDRRGQALGMSICYDLRFPELYRILAVLAETPAENPPVPPGFFSTEPSVQ